MHACMQGPSTSQRARNTGPESGRHRPAPLSMRVFGFRRRLLHHRPPPSFRRCSPTPSFPVPLTNSITRGGLYSTQVSHRAGTRPRTIKMTPDQQTQLQVSCRPFGDSRTVALFWGLLFVVLTARTRFSASWRDENGQSRMVRARLELGRVRLWQQQLTRQTMSWPSTSLSCLVSSPAPLAASS